MAAFGQYDLGLSVGGAIQVMGPSKEKGHHYSRFSDVGPVISVTAHYRRRRPKRTNLGLEVQFTHREFSMRASSGSVAGSKGIDASVQLSTVYANVIWETRTDSTGLVGYRYGFQVGALVGGSMTGRTWSTIPYQWAQEQFDNSYPSPFGGDLRGYIGLGIQASKSARHSVIVDPFLTFSITPLTSEGLGARSVEGGVKLGWLLHCPGRSRTN